MDSGEKRKQLGAPRFPLWWRKAQPNGDVIFQHETDFGTDEREDIWCAAHVDFWRSLTDEPEGTVHTMQSLGGLDLDINQRIALLDWASKKFPEATEVLLLSIQKLEVAQQLASNAFDREVINAEKEKRNPDLSRLIAIVDYLEKAIVEICGDPIEVIRQLAFREDGPDAEAVRSRFEQLTARFRDLGPLPKQDEYTPLFWHLRYGFSEKRARELLEQWATDNEMMDKVRFGGRWKIFDYDTARKFDDWLQNQLRWSGRPNARLKKP